MIPSLHTLPVELVYRILDNLDELTILLSCRNVCERLNAITDTYYRYQVFFDFIMKSHSSTFKPIVLFMNILFSFKFIRRIFLFLMTTF